MFIFKLAAAGEARDLGTHENPKKRTMPRFRSSRIQESECKYADVEVFQPSDLLFITRSLIHHHLALLAH
jgi:hypothetical protein